MQNLTCLWNILTTSIHCSTIHSRKFKTSAFRWRRERKNYSLRCHMQVTSQKQIARLLLSLSDGAGVTHQLRQKSHRDINVCGKSLYRIRSISFTNSPPAEAQKELLKSCTRTDDQFEPNNITDLSHRHSGQPWRRRKNWRTNRYAQFQ